MKRTVSGNASPPLWRLTPSKRPFVVSESVAFEPAQKSRSRTASANAPSPKTTKVERGQSEPEPGISWCDGAIPQKIAHGQAVPMLDTASVEANPAAESSPHHSSA